LLINGSATLIKDSKTYFKEKVKNVFEKFLEKKKPVPKGKTEEKKEG